MYVIGFPRSGTTWMSWLISYSMNLEMDVYEDQTWRGKTDYPWSLLRNLTHWSYQDLAGVLYKSHLYPEQIKDRKKTHPIIYVVRDGREVLTSYYYHRYWKHKRPGETRPTFTTYLEKQAPRWAGYIGAWLNSAEHTPRIIRTIKYERLREKPKRILRQTLDTIRNHFKAINRPFAEISDTIVEQAVTLFDFEKLSGRLPGQEDKTSFFRIGGTGTWKDVFTPKDHRIFWACCRNSMRIAGYKVEG